MPALSIIIPAYNAERHIEQCVNSVLSQTLHDIEIIIIDDGSLDKTGFILDELAKGYENVRIIHQENQGLYKTRDLGLKLALGDYIGWVDADDYVENDMFEILYNTAVKYNSDLVICDYSWVPRKVLAKTKWFRPFKGEIDTAFLEHNSQPWNKIVKKELMKKIEDEALFTSCFDESYILVLMQAKNPITINQKLYHYRIGRGTMSSSYTNVSHYREFVDASKKLKMIMKYEGKDSYWSDYFDYRIIYYLIITMIVAAYSGEKAAYHLSQNELHNIFPQYSKNQHYWRILKENYGSIISFFIGAIAPKSYLVTRISSRLFLNLRKVANEGRI